MTDRSRELCVPDASRAPGRVGLTLFEHLPLRPDRPNEVRIRIVRPARPRSETTDMAVDNSPQSAGVLDTPFVFTTPSSSPAVGSPVAHLHNWSIQPDAGCFDFSVPSAPPPSPVEHSPSFFVAGRDVTTPLTPRPPADPARIRRTNFGIRVTGCHYGIPKLVANQIWYAIRDCGFPSYDSEGYLVVSPEEAGAAFDHVMQSLNSGTLACSSADLPQEEIVSPWVHCLPLVPAPLDSVSNGSKTSIATRQLYFNVYRRWPSRKQVLNREELLVMSKVQRAPRDATVPRDVDAALAGSIPTDDGTTLLSLLHNAAAAPSAPVVQKHHEKSAAERRALELFCYKSIPLSTIATYAVGNGRGGEGRDIHRVSSGACRAPDHSSSPCVLDIDREKDANTPAGFPSRYARVTGATMCRHLLRDCACRVRSDSNGPVCYFFPHSLYYMTSADFADMRPSDTFLAIVHVFPAGSLSGTIHGEFQWELDSVSGIVTMKPLDGFSGSTYRHLVPGWAYQTGDVEALGWVIRLHTARTDEFTLVVRGLFVSKIQEPILVPQPDLLAVHESRAALVLMPAVCNPDPSRAYVAGRDAISSLLRSGVKLDQISPLISRVNSSLHDLLGDMPTMAATSSDEAWYRELKLSWLAWGLRLRRQVALRSLQVAAASAATVVVIKVGPLLIGTSIINAGAGVVNVLYSGVLGLFGPTFTPLVTTAAAALTVSKVASMSLIPK